MHKLKFLIILIFGFFSLCFAEESITITTYYPSPYGSYNSLQANKLAVGDTSGDGQLTSADQPPANGQIYTARSVIYKPQNGTPSSNAVAGELVYNTNDSSFYYYDGSAWVKLGGGWYVPTSVITTTATHDGNFGSYQAIYNWIQTNGCSGYHVCDNTELSRYYQTHAPTDITGWYNTGLYAPYVYEGTESYSLCDCHGWTVNSGNPLSGYWAVSRPSEAWCYSSNKVVCCK